VLPTGWATHLLHQAKHEERSENCYASLCDRPGHRLWHKAARLVDQLGPC
jgi:hypothetical protein